jgi:hypothetical protein
MGGCIGRELFVYVVRSEGKKLVKETVFLEELKYWTSDVIKILEINSNRTKRSL